MALNCKKCRKPIVNKQFLKCSVCENNFHVDCTNVSFQRFRIMTSDNKKAHRCDPCFIKSKSSSTAHEPFQLSLQNSSTQSCQSVRETSTPLSNAETTLFSSQGSASIQELDYVTQRDKCRVNIPTNNSFAELNEYEEFSSPTSSPVGNTQQSPSKLGFNTEYKEKELIEKIYGLETKLKSAEIKIDKLARENITLTKKITKCENRNNPVLKTEHRNAPEKNIKILDLERKINRLSNELIKAQEEIAKLNEILLQNIKKNTSLTQPTRYEDTNISFQEKNNNMGKHCNYTASLGKRRKLCILTNNPKYKITEIMHTDDFYGEFEICHYIYTSGNIETLTKEIECKVKSFTRNDYCIVMIGDTDFYKSQDCNKLIGLLQTKLEKLMNTNVIVTAPTYICGKPLFNYRVETFNTELYRKLHSLENNIHVFDSNEPLTYEMFSPVTGKLLIKGMRCILRRLADLITSIEFNNQEDLTAYKPRTQNEETCNGKTTSPSPVTKNVGHGTLQKNLDKNK